jgi:septal ring factor EnvC (AmiA/AmiB activator)
MNGCRNAASLLIAFFLLAVSCWAQDKEELQQERDKISQEISLTNKLLKETRANRDQVEGKLSLLNRKINLREDLISSLQREIALYNQKIENNRRKISDLENKLKTLKDKYANMVRFAQRSHRPEDRLMYIFASDDFFQAIRRIRYLKQYARYREEQAEDIVKTREKLSELNAGLLAVISEKDSIMVREQESKQDLTSDLSEQKSTVSSLQQEEQALQKKLRKQEKQRTKLNKEIQRIIEAEIRASKKDNEGVFELTPEAAALSANFEKNKGKLPWPVERGVITSGFGKNAHPVLAGITVINNGVDIATSSNAEVRAVFDGTVSATFSIPGAGKNVIINHGGYRSVYSNLKEVLVSKGQKVSNKQAIGRVLTDERGYNQAGSCTVDIQKISVSSWRLRISWFFNNEPGILYKATLSAGK